MVTKNFNTDQHSRSISFLPIYFDEDYNHHFIKAQHAKHKDKHEEGEHDHHDDLVEVGDQAVDPTRKPERLTPGQIDKACIAFGFIDKFVGSVYAKNEKIGEVFPFVQTVLNNPQLLYQSSLRHKKRFQKITTAMHIVRSFNTLDANSISILGLKGIRPLVDLNQFIFSRSFERVASFTSSAMTDKFLCAVIVNRRLQVYDFLANRLLFEMNVPSSGSVSYGASCYFVDGDSLLVVQDGACRLSVINVQAKIEAFSSTNMNQEIQDITFKIEGPTVIDNDFNIENEELEEERAEKVSEESEIVSP